MQLDQQRPFVSYSTNSDGFGPQRTPTGYRSQRSYTRAPPSQQTIPAFAGGAGYNDAYDEEESYEMESLPQQQRRSPAELQTMEGFFREVSQSGTCNSG